MDGLIAFATKSPGGLEASLSAHFGRCACFTLVAIRDGRMERLQVLTKTEHIDGDCASSVRTLESRGVRAVVVNGIGERSLAELRASGLDVFRGERGCSIRLMLEDLRGGRLPRFGPDLARISRFGQHAPPATRAASELRAQPSSRGKSRIANRRD